MLGGVAGWNAYPGFRCGVDELGMLLGPEKTPVGGVFLVAMSGLDRLTHPPLLLLGWVWWWLWWVGVWWCVECCIVDASIFFVSGFVVCACLLCVKCCRAQGGCLGIRSR